MHAGDVMCYDPWKGVNEETQHIASMWDYQWCTEMWMPNGRDGVTDVFWSEPWDPEASARWCESVWGVRPRRLRATVEWGGRRLEALSNVVFSNGLYDPWHGGGVLEDLSDTVKVRRQRAVDVLCVWLRICSACGAAARRGSCTAEGGEGGAGQLWKGPESADTRISMHSWMCTHCGAADSQGVLSPRHLWHVMPHRLVLWCRTAAVDPHGGVSRGVRLQCDVLAAGSWECVGCRQSSFRTAHTTSISCSRTRTTPTR